MPNLYNKANMDLQLWYRWVHMVHDALSQPDKIPHLRLKLSTIIIGNETYINVDLNPFKPAWRIHTHLTQSVQA